MRFVTLAILALFFCIMIQSCDADEEEYGCGICPPTTFHLGFFNEHGNTYVGYIYKQDSFRLYNAMEEYYLTYLPNGKHTRFLVSFDSLTSGSDYFLEFSPTDIDTLRFSFEVEQQPHCRIYSFTEVLYNGESQKVESSLIDIIK